MVLFLFSSCISLLSKKRELRKSKAIKNCTPTSIVPPHIQIRKDISTCSAPATHNEQGSLVKRDIGQLEVVQSSRHSNGSQDHSHQVPNSIPDMAEMVDGTLECAQVTGMMVCVYRNKMMYCQKPHLDERCLS